MSIDRIDEPTPTRVGSRPDAMLLVVAHTFPPSAEVGSQRILGLCRHLPEHGVRPVILTVRAECLRRRDETVAVPEWLRVERTSVAMSALDLYSKLRAGANTRLVHGEGSPARKAARREGARRGFLRRQLLSLLTAPDPQRGWYRPALEAGADLLGREPFDAVFSSGPPWTSHLVAKGLKGRAHLPWVADYRDPWSGNSEPDAPSWRRWLDGRLEHACVREADLTVCNTDELRDAFRLRYDGLDPRRFLTIPNGFESPSLEKSEPPARRDPRKLCLHLGSLYGGRRIDSFCAAFEELYRRGALPSCRVLLVGEADECFKREAAAAAPAAWAAGLIEFRGSVPSREARSLLAAADVLLIFQGELRLQIPAKFYGYLPTGKPILAVAARGALTRALDETASGFWAEAASPEGVSKALLAALGRGPYSPAEVEARWAGLYHYRSLAARLAASVLALRAGRGAGGRRGSAVVA